VTGRVVQVQFTLLALEMDFFRVSQSWVSLSLSRGVHVFYIVEP
jgi:hypothetical protein